MKDSRLRRTEFGTPLTADPDGLVALRVAIRPVLRDGTVQGEIAAEVWTIPAGWDFVQLVDVIARGLRSDGRLEQVVGPRFDFKPPAAPGER